MKINNLKFSFAPYLIITLFGCGNEIGDNKEIRTLENVEPLPEFVYIPTKNTTSKVLVKANNVAEVGDWVELNATRETSGDWLKIRRVEVPEEINWYISIPNGFESEVAANLSWKVEPSENFKFDVASFKNINSMSRKVKFSKPGVYRLRAYSASPIRSTSNIIEIRVE